MLISVGTVLLFAVGVWGLMLYPKTGSRMNGMKMAVMGIMAVFCYLSFWAFVYNKAGIAIGLPSTCVALAVLDLALWGGILYKRRIQKLFWRVSELVCLILLAAFVIWIAMYMFTPELQLQYYNIDAAPHFEYANLIVHTGKLHMTTYFSAYIDALFIWLFSPELMPIMYYKAFIIADIFMHVLEIWMFYYLILTISERKIVRMLAPIITLGYFWGYPAYSYMEGHFVYWSNGVMIYIFILYALLLVEKYRTLHRYTALLLGLGVYANTCCNKLFVPTNTLAVIAVLAIIVGQKYWGKISKKKFGIVAGGGILLLAVVGSVYLYTWRGVFATLLDDLRIVGGIYSALFADLIFFLPVWIYVIYCVIKKIYIQRTIIISSLCMLAITIGMYCLWSWGYMSQYYYYKIYYNVWLSCWLLAVVALELMAKEKKLTWYFSYMGMVVLIAWITLSDYDTKVAEVHEDYRSWNATTQMFSIYNYNANHLRIDYEQFQISEQQLDVWNYAINEMNAVDVRIVSENANTKAWYDAIDCIHGQGFYLEKYELTELLAQLDAEGVQAIVVNRTEEKYKIYSDYFERCRVVYSNGDAAILMPAGERWLEISPEAYEPSAEKQELIVYAREELAGQPVPLLASQEAYYDYMFYYMASLNSSEDVYPWKQALETDEELPYEEELQALAENNIKNLRDNEIQYVLLFYDDAFYQQTKEYFDKMQVVFENDAGKIIAIDMEDEQ